MPAITCGVPQLSRAKDSWVKGSITEGGTSVGSFGLLLASCKSQLLNKKRTQSSSGNEIKNVFGAPKKDEILITAVGTLGNVYLIPDNSKFYFKDGNLIWLRNIRNILPAFLEIQINWLKDEIINNAIGSSQKALTIVVLNKQSVAYPNSISEQQAIISILKDMDSDILTLESKLEKYRQIKSGMMQNLLTGKIRLI